MYQYIILFVILLTCLQLGCLSGFEVSDASASKVLSRQKRYVAFPEGSSLSTAGCVTVGVIGQPAPHNNPGTFTWSVNWAIAYELPNSTELSGYYRLKKYITHNHMLRRKNRRDLYGKLETILDNMGYSGRECILKTLCETSQRLTPNGSNMIEEMFRILFTLPLTKVLNIEPLEHSIYESAQRIGRIMDSCEKFKCPVSLVDLVKGYYDAPSPNTDVARRTKAEIYRAHLDFAQALLAPMIKENRSSLPDMVTNIV